MKILNVEITDELGLHALTISQLNVLVQLLDCKITMQKFSKMRTETSLSKNSEVDLKNLFLMMQLNICYGDFIKVVCNGKDEEIAHKQLWEFFSGLGRCNEQ